jgi:hypothetical protein
LSEKETNSNSDSPGNYNGAEELVQKHPEGESENVIEAVPNTPLTLVRKDGKWLFAWLNYVVSQAAETREDAMRMLETQKWEIQAMYMMALLDKQGRGGIDVE